MAGLIPQDFIAELLSKVDIVDTIALRIELKKKGSEYAACCPFHNEKTPSFYVSPSKQFYHCFGCGAHGTAISFLMEYDNLNFPEAVEQLADSVGLTVPRSASAPRKIYDHSTVGILNETAAIYAATFRQLPADHPVKLYVQSRGLSETIIEQYQIGYAPASIKTVQQTLNCDNSVLLNAGLLSESETGIYARFRDRVMFPIRNRRGDVIGFGGRGLGDAKPKYLNSSESDIFEKGRELYGLFEARKSSPRLAELIVVEGYMDVVALAQFGLTNAVATLGTATTEHHAALLARSVRRITFCFDGDQAGRKAGWKALEHMSEAMRDGLSVRFLFLPEGEDPDSLVRQEGVTAFRERMESGITLAEFLVKRLRSANDLDTIDGRANALTQAIPLLAKFPAGTHLDSLVPEVADLTRQHEPTIWQKLTTHRQQQFRHQDNADAATFHRPAAPQESNVNVAKTPLRRAIALLLCAPQLHQDRRVQMARARLPKPQQDESFALLHHVLEILDNAPSSTTAMIIAQVENPRMQQALSKLATWRPIINDALLTDDLVDALHQLTHRYDPRKALLEKLQRGETLTDAEQATIQRSPSHTHQPQNDEENN